MEDSYERLKNLLRQTGGAVVAFSGGVDSTLLLAAAQEALGRQVLAVTGVSPTYSEKELSRARELAKHLAARHLVIKTLEFHDPAYRANPPNRCYFCKKDLFTKLKEIGSQEGLPFVIDGSNADDLADFRPGHEAARELGIRSPFVELGVGKTEIRRMAKALGLSNWNQPSQACLASRIPYGQEITLAKLDHIGRAGEPAVSAGLSPGTGAGPRRTGPDRSFSGRTGPSTSAREKTANPRWLQESWLHVCMLGSGRLSFWLDE